jgi:hypothetical protein
MSQFGADLIVGGGPGEAFEHLGRGGPGREDARDDAVIEMADDLDDFGSGGRGRGYSHRNTSATVRRCCPEKRRRAGLAPPAARCGRSPRARDWQKSIAFRPVLVILGRSALNIPGRKKKPLSRP